jgi:uncharacterized RDD family membrane protein YckC
MTIMEPAFDGEFPKETKKTIVPKKLPALYQRYFATLIDYVFVFSCAYFISIYTPLFNGDSAASFLPIIAVLFIYDALFTSKLCTVGQLIFKFRVRNYNGLERIGFLLALKRTVIKLVLGAYSLVAILFNRERRAVHDLITATIAVSPKDTK